MCGFTSVHTEDINHLVHNEYFHYDNVHIMQSPYRGEIYEEV